MMTPTGSQYPTEMPDNQWANTDVRAGNNSTTATFNWAKLTDQEKQLFYKLDKKFIKNKNDNK